MTRTDDSYVQRNHVCGSVFYEDKHFFSQQNFTLLDGVGNLGQDVEYN
jgi:hypothetical protein